MIMQKKFRIQLILMYILGTGVANPVGKIAKKQRFC